MEEIKKLAVEALKKAIKSGNVDLITTLTNLIGMIDAKKLR
jgi:hypothetical protein